MEITGLTKKNRAISICLVGLAHDKVETVLTEQIMFTKKEGELRFWESGTRNKNLWSDDINLEDFFSATMTFLYSLLTVFLFELSYYQGHGDIESYLITEFQSGKRKGYEIYKNLTEHEKLIYQLCSVFVRRLCQENIMEDAVLDYFNGDKEIMTEFTNSVIKFKERLPLSGCTLNITMDTLHTINVFIAEFYKLLTTRKERLHGELQNAEILIREMKENFISERKYHLFPVVNANYRDLSNWRYIQKILKLRPTFKRIILFVGCGHVPNLRKLIAQHNLDSNNEIYYINICEIIAPYVDISLDLTKPVDRDELKPKDLSPNEIYQYSSMMNKKIKYWRKFTKPYQSLVKLKRIDSEGDSNDRNGKRKKFGLYNIFNNLYCNPSEGRGKGYCVACGTNKGVAYEAEKRDRLYCHQYYCQIIYHEFFLSGKCEKLMMEGIPDRLVFQQFLSDYSNI